MTVTNDIRRMQADLVAVPDGEASWDDEILRPENFVQWRARAFFNSDEGIPYETPRQQEAWFLGDRHLRSQLRSRGAEDDDPRLGDRIPAAAGRHQRAAVPGLGVRVPHAHGTPRHGKTDLACHIAIWLIIKWRRIRILMCMAIGDTVEDSIRMIRRQLNENEYLARWGPFKSSPWNSTMLRVVGAAMDAKTNTLRGVSIDTDITSKDADLIIFDDPQGVRTDTTQEVVDAQYSLAAGRAHVEAGAGNLGDRAGIPHAHQDRRHLEPHRARPGRTEHARPHGPAQEDQGARRRAVQRSRRRLRQAGMRPPPTTRI